METIDLTPTWTTAVRICIEVLKNESAPPSAKLEAEHELMRLASHVDQQLMRLAEQVDHNKETK